ncbi:hypothetical protein [Chitinophaga pinensis]|uniref:Lipoprotein n=1 Tax=Chitinophaga pinensis (strain ATCC 43595 / DSM 2588 / LMG 13176 / NBRC 15968 / NCIMB 11800 / UQM 2034) TaxID=485918 RepID=A0A979G3C6_CHIPD|nr:hypothetical protein [Chitinophaga pinensis]ACU59981.1 hypothetical protein Cpin_2493 [Chitinophaga pinensis DSM 2588]
MKKTRLNYILTKQFYYLPLILLAIASISTGCRKTKAPNPCEDLISEKAPTQVNMVLIDGQTGENILLSGDIDEAAITVTQELESSTAVPFGVIKDAGSPRYGSLAFLITDTRKGAFKYKITIPTVGTTTLSYTNKEEKADNPCKPYYIIVTDPVLEERPYTLTRTSGRLLFQLTL